MDFGVLERIDLFPIKSLDGVSVDTAKVLSSGALQHDREWAIVDAAGKIVNGKRTAQIQQLRATFDLESQLVRIATPRQAAQDFHLLGDRAGLEQFLSDHFGFAVSLIQNQETGFPDDLDSPGPTVISTATLAAVSQWYPGTDVAEMRRRFRTNLELTGIAAFDEDQLFDQADRPRRFRIGQVQFEGINPCQRCIVPTRDSQSGQPTAEFQKTFLRARSASLPATVNRDRFNHFYRLAVNTRIPPHQAVQRLDRGDSCESITV
jgi:uncharacterized protein